MTFLLYLFVLVLTVKTSLALRIPTTGGWLSAVHLRLWPSLCIRLLWTRLTAGSLEDCGPYLYPQHHASCICLTHTHTHTEIDRESERVRDTHTNTHTHTHTHTSSCIHSYHQQCVHTDSNYHLFFDKETVCCSDSLATLLFWSCSLSFFPRD